MSELRAEQDLENGPKPADSAEGERGPGLLLSIPNQLTIMRLVLSVVFFVLLGLVGHGTYAGFGRTVALNGSAAIFGLAVLTDFLDGYLARRWGLVSTFGRIADPFADKIVVCGGFIMLIGISGGLIEPWYAVVILFREFLVSGLRSFLESRGVAFGATFSGKLKMVLQSVTIPVVILYEANFADGSRELDLARLVTLTFLVLTLLLTLVSSIGYVQRAIKLIRG